MCRGEAAKKKNQRKKKSKNKGSVQGENGTTQNGNENASESTQENKHYVKNPIVWIDMEMTGTVLLWAQFLAYNQEF